MAAPNTATSVDSASAEELSAKALQKRYEGLVMVRNKAIKGKGTWYWSHLEPMLLHNTETGLPKAVKLRCSLCEAVFSASNPSRTASEHFKRGTCPNFSSLPKPISSIAPINIAATSSPSLANNRKRSSAPPSSYHVPTRFCGEVAYTSPPATATTPHLMLSGGKEDLGALAILVSRDEAHIALMELMKWRTEGLDPVYARAVQMKERDSVTGKMRIANPQSSRLVWETYLTGFKSLGRVAVRLIFLHATSCNFKCNWKLWTSLRGHGHSATSLDKAQKLIFIAAHSKLKRRDFSSDEDKEAELFTLANSEDDLFNEVLVDTSPV
ncbi:hypothetical protein TanjilG_06628 [Lupinus angustifolius]|uniref:DUF7963 domain-containing protein n=1 Tax=Lupinus angustifolius TaxID=3871 RepID=A0A1J7H2K2_LUPAN|nr:hypothetical protein TanjilG_06628 [Lupinus angustifolius]